MSRPPSSVHRPPPALFVLLTTSSLLLTGCIHRQLTVRTEPPGAMLSLNDKPIGKTPFSYDFTWYGTYRLLLTKEGYEPVHDKPSLMAPWYFWIPLDLLLELWPGQVNDVRVLSYQLVKRQEPAGPTAPVYEEKTPESPETAESHDDE